APTKSLRLTGADLPTAYSRPRRLLPINPRTGALLVAFGHVHGTRFTESNMMRSASLRRFATALLIVSVLPFAAQEAAALDAHRDISQFTHGVWEQREGL